jgi:hypothetical protein
MVRDRSPSLFVLALGLAVVAACGREEPAVAPLRAPAMTPAEVAAFTRALEPRLAAPPGGWRATRDARGREVLKLGRRFQGMTLATQAADGSTRVECVSSSAEARAFLSGAQAAPGSHR